MGIRNRVGHALLAVGFGICAGCGGSKAPAEAPVLREEPVQTQEDASSVSVSSDVGALNEEAVTRVFEDCLSGLESCLKAGARRNEYLGGDVTFYLGVDQSGKVAKRQLEKSNLGDQETEKCMLNVLGGHSWPKPVGGKLGNVHKSFTFDPPSGVRPAIAWDSEEIQKTLSKQAGKIDDCKNGVRGEFYATLYVKKDGKPLAAGVTPPSPDGEKAADCLVQVLMEARYPSPGSWAAKVQVAL